MATRAKHTRSLLVALAFLAPNIIGMLTFVAFPLVFSLAMALTNWDLRRHNMFESEALEFVGLENFVRLLSEPEFFKFLGNTLFLMMAVPFSVGGSLLAAMLLSKDAITEGARRRRFRLILGAGAAVVVAVALALGLGLGAGGMTMIVIVTLGTIAIIGTFGGASAYRTLFYMPHFTAGVATFILWKMLYNPQVGPINVALRPVLDALSNVVNTTPGGAWQALALVVAGLLVLLLGWSTAKLREMWANGDLGSGAAVVALGLVVIPVVLAAVWSQARPYRGWLVGAALAVMAWQGVLALKRGRSFRSSGGEGAGTGFMLGLAVLTVESALLGLSAAVYHLPGMAAIDGLHPPGWIYDYQWAKPSLMVMGLWAAIGSNNMLLYLAALTNVPGDLYEAANIDGAGRFQKFWHVTWPQLAPTTFFISVMATIAGLQGGFEMARTMTQGGPAGATTTLSYFIYIEGFQTGQLGFASAVAWTLFVMVFGVTLFNWKFGNRYVND